jgi:hypothetical protein
VSELPGRPNIHQLRRQARELLRAAADGEPSALTRIHAFSERVSLSAAQLAVAREYGFASWPALHAAVGSRLALLRRFPGRGAGIGETRWSLAGASPVEIAMGTLYPRGLVAGPGHAFLEASLVPTGRTRGRLAMPPPPISSSAREAHGNAIRDLAKAIVGAVALTDDVGAKYALRVEDIQHYRDQSQEHSPVSLRLGVDPVPARERGWLELRGKDGAATRLMSSADPHVRVSRHAVPDSPVRELSQQALELIGVRLRGAGQGEVEQWCSAALVRAEEIQHSGGLGAAGDLPGQLAQLCAVLTGDDPADGLPSGWSGMIDAADRIDGASRHLDVSVTLPQVDDTVVRIDSLISEPDTWRVYLHAEPGWWIHNPDMNQKRAVMSVAATDDHGGIYLSQFDGGHGRLGDFEEVTLRFHPRLNPLARALTLTFSHACEQVDLELQMP